MTVRARRQHQCYWCGEPIEIGEAYKRLAFFGLHTECNDAWNRRECFDKVSFGLHYRGRLCERPKVPVWEGKEK